MGGDAVFSNSSEDPASMVDNHKFDGAVIDWDIEGLDPEKLTERIRRSSSNSGIPIAILSNRHLQSDVGRTVSFLCSVAVLLELFPYTPRGRLPLS